jgi:tRNA(Ile)-lysidine synthase
VRYDWLRQVAQDAGSRWVATGHTADDQAETLLHRLLRGTGLHGLRGIAGQRPLAPDVTLVRPLLAVPRSQLLAYLESLGQPYRQDSSNENLRLTRNRIRHELLPLLRERYNPAIVSVLCHLAAQAEEAAHEVELAAAALLTAAERPRAGPLLVFDRAVLTAAPAHQVRAMFRLLWEREGWPRGEMNFVAWDRMAAVARGELVAVDLPGGVRVRCRERVVHLERVC